VRYGRFVGRYYFKNNDLFVEFKGTLTEQFVLQQLVNKNYTPFYWAPENAKSEVDFIIQKENQIVPIEVKSAENLKSRSLRLYFDKYQPPVCIRTSLAGYQKQEWMENIPLYSIQNWLKHNLSLRVN